MLKPAISVETGQLKAKFHETGQLAVLTGNDKMINQVIQNPLENRLTQLYVRKHQGEKILIAPLLTDTARFSYSASGVKYEGKAFDATYTVLFTLIENYWFYEVAIEGSGTFDFVYIQDLSLADSGAVRSNEAYISQYIDMKVTDTTDSGYVIQARQNQPQNGEFPAVQIGSFQKTIGFATDGFDIYGTTYKTTEEPTGLYQKQLPNRVYQYEFTEAVLQTESFRDKAEFVFYGKFSSNQPEASGEPVALATIRQAYVKQREIAWQAGTEVQWKRPLGPTISGKAVEMQIIDERYPDRIQEEWQGEELLSFFTPDYKHVVLPVKETQLLRPHGTILLDQVDPLHPENTLSASSYMYGLFLSQAVLGNTNMNKWNSNARNPLNLLKTSGVRVYLETEAGLQNLGMPSLWEITTNEAVWHYWLADDVITVRAFITATSKTIELAISSARQRAYSFVITNQVTMGANEYEQTPRKHISGKTVTYQLPANSLGEQIYPELAYQVTGDYDQITDERYFADVYQGTAELDVFVYPTTSEAHFYVQASFDGEFSQLEIDHAEDRRKFRSHYDELTAELYLEHPSRFTEKINITVFWYTHQMLVHYAAPHGLEQYSGAAWGTRDVSQGPFEFFYATGNQPVMKAIIETVFSHQYEQTGDWPQWFMFDKYTAIQQEESHGDVIVWPLKMLGDYLEATGDTDILSAELPYVDSEAKAFIAEKATLLEHVQKAVATIEARFMPGTYLSNYGDGDWDDTLQPANSQLKASMVSSWTVALTYQVLGKLADWLPESERYQTIAEGIYKDFHQYMLGETDIIPGFLNLEDPQEVRYMIHPNDKETNSHYRLIPMTQSVISELVDAKQAAANFDIIREHLFYPDGVRLMDRPANYTGGVSRHFKRAEQAANFGREIGLQYVHAHIRYVEALAKVGNTEAWEMLEKINPINISEAVPNAAARQANTYFSSSDAAFINRYEAQEKYDLVKKGGIPVQGGWRIYSSGPGIYLNQLISSVLGIRQTQTQLLFDPVLPNELDGLEAHIQLAGKRFDIQFIAAEKRSIEINGETAVFEQEANPYREGALSIDKNQLPNNAHLTIYF